MSRSTSTSTSCSTRRRASWSTCASITNGTGSSRPTSRRETSSAARSSCRRRPSLSTTPNTATRSTNSACAGSGDPIRREVATGGPPVRRRAMRRSAKIGRVRRDGAGRPSRPDFISSPLRRCCVSLVASPMRAASVVLAFFAAAFSYAADPVPQWGRFELALPGPAGGNPFVDVSLGATFTHGAVTHDAPGFYDGEGVYRIRFMPEATGEWSYVTHSNRAELAGRTGAFTVTAPAAGHHGPVRVAHTFHFAYADGTPYAPFGTTCYAWIHQGDALEA